VEDSGSLLVVGSQLPTASPRLGVSARDSVFRVFRLLRVDGTVSGPFFRRVTIDLCAEPGVRSRGVPWTSYSPRRGSVAARGRGGPCPVFRGSWPVARAPRR